MGYPHTIPDLPYAYDALEPYIDAATMHEHHDKHHQAYANNLNKALESLPELQKLSVEQLLRTLDEVPEASRTAVRNHGGGVWNHSFFWPVMGKSGTKPEGALKTALEQAFGSYDAFKEAFTKAAMGRFGSGWAWLVLDKGKLAIMSTANQDSPINEGKAPLLCIDVWEHAYYLKYQSKRAAYVEAFFNVINWKKVAEHYAAAKK